MQKVCRTLELLKKAVVFDSIVDLVELLLLLGLGRVQSLLIYRVSCIRGVHAGVLQSHRDQRIDRALVHAK